MIGDHIITYSDITKMPYLTERIAKGTSQNDSNKKSDSIGLAGQIDSGLDKNVASGKFRKNINGIEYNITENNNEEYEFLGNKNIFSLPKNIVNKMFNSPNFNNIINSGFPIAAKDAIKPLKMSYNDYEFNLTKKEKLRLLFFHNYINVSNTSFKIS